MLYGTGTFNIDFHGTLVVTTTQRTPPRLCNGPGPAAGPGEAGVYNAARPGITRLSLISLETGFVRCTIYVHVHRRYLFPSAADVDLSIGGRGVCRRNIISKCTKTSRKELQTVLATGHAYSTKLQIFGRDHLRRCIYHRSPINE